MDYDEIKKEVKRYFHSTMWNRHLEDCTSYCCVKLLENPKCWIKFLVIDYMRHEGLTTKRPHLVNKIFNNANDGEIESGKNDRYVNLLDSFRYGLEELGLKNVDKAVKYFENQEWKKLKDELYRLYYYANESLPAYTKSMEGLKGYCLYHRIRTVYKQEFGE